MQQQIQFSWMNAPFTEWPAEIRVAYGLMAKAAQRRMEAEKQANRPTGNASCATPDADRPKHQNHNRRTAA